MKIEKTKDGQERLLSVNQTLSVFYLLFILIAGFFVTIWVSAVMFKSNEIVKRQTALKVLGLDCTIPLNFFPCNYLHATSLLSVQKKVVHSISILQGDRNVTFLVGISLAFMLHVISIYWWYQSDDLLYPLIMVPPKSVPPFWHAIFTILVNGMYLLSIGLQHFYPNGKLLCCLFFQLLHYSYIRYHNVQLA